MNVIISLVFLLLFILFIYGALFIACLGLANWLLHSWLSAVDTSLVFVTALAFVLGWACLSFAVSRLVYFICLCYGNKKRAGKIAEISLFAMFHIFAMPVLFWRMFVQNYLPLRRYYRNKLKKIARHKRQQRTNPA